MQNSVSFAEALAVSRPRATKHAFFSGSSCKTEVLQEPHYTKVNKKFTDEAWNDYQYWIENDKKLLKRINLLIKEIDRNPYEGIGKPEPLKANLHGYWSRRINSEHRIVYAVENKQIVYISFRFHY